MEASFPKLYSILRDILYFMYFILGMKVFYILFFSYKRRIQFFAVVGCFSSFLTFPTLFCSVSLSFIVKLLSFSFTGEKKKTMREKEMIEVKKETINTRSLGNTKYTLSYDSPSLFVVVAVVVDELVVNCVD